jgi:hypothetical protein
MAIILFNSHDPVRKAHNYFYSFARFTCTEVSSNCKIYFFFTCAITLGTDVMVSLLEVSYVYFVTVLNFVWALISVWLQGRYITLKLAMSLYSGRTESTN